MAQISQIEDPVVSRAVFTDYPTPIHGKDHRQIGQADVMDNLVIGPLQEGRVYCHHRPEASPCQSGGKGNGMLFCYTHIITAVGKPLGQQIKARSLGHGRGNAHYPVVPLGKLYQCFGKDLCIGGSPPLLLCLPRHRIKGTDTVKAIWFCFRRGVALTLDSNHMEEDGPFDPFGTGEDLFQQG